MQERRGVEALTLKSIRVFINESDRLSGGTLALAVLEMMHQEGAEWAGVLRGISGFGARRRIHTTQVERLAVDLPLIIDCVASEAVAAKVLERLEGMLREGVVVVSDVQASDRGRHD